MVDKAILSQYGSYYGSPELREWRRLGALDKVDNIVELVGSQATGSVVDIGCGDGAVVEQLALRGVGARFAGVDISSSAIEMAMARSLPAARFSVFSGDSLPFADGEFDLAVLSHVVEHLEHPRVLLAEARRVARRVVVEVPCEHTMRLPRDYVPRAVGHINFYTPKTIRCLVQTCGFEVERQITRGCSLDVMRFESPATGMMRYLLREAAIRIAPQVAPSVFVYHTALLCR